MSQAFVASGGPANLRTLLEVLEWQASARPDREVYRFCFENEADSHLTFGELYERAKTIAGHLQRFARPLDRVLLVFPPGLDFVAAFFGCICAGVLAVPATYPKPKRPMPRLTAIAKDCGASVALTTSQTLTTLDIARVAPELGALRWITIDSIAPEFAQAWERPELKPEDLAFLQYTSGSTSEPKGVMISHRNLMANLEMIRCGFDIPWVKVPEQPGVGVFWLPAYHDMGLIGGILMALYTGGHSVLMSPTSFLQRPVRWLEAISENRALVSGGPNFSYDLCVRKITDEEKEKLDLSCWRVAFCGAEPIRAETLENFARAFAPCGFNPAALYPCYGLAEATLLASGGIGPRKPAVLYVSREALANHRVEPVDESAKSHSQPLVGCGSGLLRQEIAIVNAETGERVGPGQVGEIWLKGENVAVGYWNREEENERIFRAQLSPTGEGPYLRTGDLGFILNGELYVTGRIKEVIIIRGRNLYPQDLELTVQHAHPALLPSAGAAFAVDIDGQERLVVVQEVDRHYRHLDLAEVIREIRRLIAEEHEVELHAVVLIRQASLPRTTSGKIQRNLCREWYLNGQLKVIAEWVKNVKTEAASGPQTRERVTGIEAPPRQLTSSGNGERREGSSRQELAAGRLSSSGNGRNGKLTKLLASARDFSEAGVRRLAQQIEEVLLSWLVDRAGVAPEEVDRFRPFAEYGLDSLAAVELAEELEQALNLQLTPTLVWNYPTPASLAEYLAAMAAGRVPEEELCEPTAEPLSATKEFEDLLAEVERLGDGEVSATPNTSGNRISQHHS